MPEPYQRYPCVLEAFEPSLGRVVRLGKIVPVTVRCDGDTVTNWMYVNNLSAKLVITDSFGVACCVVQLMKEWEVERALYWWGGVAYQIALGRLAQFTPWAMGSRRYFQVPIKAWQPYREDCSIQEQWADRVLTLSWDEADRAYAPEAAQQLGLAI